MTLTLSGMPTTRESTVAELSGGKNSRYSGSPGAEEKIKKIDIRIDIKIIKLIVVSD